MADTNRIKERAIDAAALREQLSYDPVSGVFVWLNDRGFNPRSKAGTQAGTVLPTGYRLIRVDGYRYLAHRLAWFYVHGVWPSGEIDHLNQQKDDNAISNLRDVDRKINVWNREMSPHKRRSGYVARLYRDGKIVIRRQFPTKELATLAREIALAQFNALNGYAGV
jgi:hypothetical protein